MVDYVIINGTNAELTNVNVGGDDVAAYTISANLTLTDAELATVASLNGVAVMQASASAAEKAAVGDLLIDGSGAAPGTDYEIVNGSDSALTNVNAGGNDLTVDPPPSGSLTGPLATGVSLTPSEAWALLATAGVYVAKTAATVEATNKARRKAARVMKYRKAVVL